ncbi:MAG: helix-turn-helix domain-containing protein [Muribaculaceae bacterium]
MDSINELNLNDIAIQAQQVPSTVILHQDDDILCMKTESDKITHLGKSSSTDTSFFLLCTNGSITIKFPNRTIVINRYEAVFVRPKALFLDVEVSNDFKGYWLGINMRFTRGMIRLDKGVQQIIFYLISNNMVKLTNDEGRIMEAYFQLMQVKSGHSGYYAKETASSIIRALLYDFFSHVRDELVNKNISTEPIHSADTMFLRFTALLYDHNATSRKVSYYADQLCISSKYLSYICRTMCGKTAMAIINEHMTQNIKYYLEHTTLSVKEISILLDFPSLSFFGRYVKKHLGMSPNAYRAEATK